MKRTLIALGATLCLASSASALPDYPRNGTIGIYTDAVATSCCLQAAPGAPAIAHVLMTLAGATAAGGPTYTGGITGAEFRIEISDPAGYFFIWSPGAAFNTTIGDPMDATPADPTDPKGTNMASASCQPAGPPPMTGDRVALGTIQILNFGAGMPCDLIVKRKSPPSNPIQANCPLVTLCDGPVFTKACLGLQPNALPPGHPEPQHFVATLNKPCGGGVCGFVGTESATWTSLKSLFR